MTLIHLESIGLTQNRQDKWAYHAYLGQTHVHGCGTYFCDDTNKHRHGNTWDSDSAGVQFLCNFFSLEVVCTNLSNTIPCF